MVSARYLPGVPTPQSCEPTCTHPTMDITYGCMLTLRCAYREETCEQAAVLHYTYNRFEDLKSRRDRCDCAPTEDDAKRCFILPFDRSVSWLIWTHLMPLSPLFREQNINQSSPDVVQSSTSAALMLRKQQPIVIGYVICMPMLRS